MRKLNVSHRRETQTCHTDVKTKFVTQTFNRRKTKVITQTDTAKFVTQT